MLDHDVLASFSLFNFSHHGTLQQRDGRHKRQREGTTWRDAKGEWTTNMKDDAQGDDADDMKDDAKGDNADDTKAAWMGDVSGSLFTSKLIQPPLSCVTPHQNVCLTLRIT